MAKMPETSHTCTYVLDAPAVVPYCNEKARGRDSGEERQHNQWSPEKKHNGFIMLERGLAIIERQKPGEKDEPKAEMQKQSRQPACTRPSWQALGPPMLGHSHNPHSDDEAEECETCIHRRVDGVGAPTGTVLADCGSSSNAYGRHLASRVLLSPHWCPRRLRVLTVSLDRAPSQPSPRNPNTAGLCCRVHNAPSTRPLAQPHSPTRPTKRNRSENSARSRFCDLGTCCRSRRRQPSHKVG